MPGVVTPSGIANTAFFDAGAGQFVSGTAALGNQAAIQASSFAQMGPAMPPQMPQIPMASAMWQQASPTAMQSDASIPAPLTTQDRSSRPSKPRLKTAIPIEDVPDDVIKAAADVMMKQSRIKATPKGFRCLAKNGNIYLLRHRSGKLFAIDFKGGQAFHMSLVYFPQIGSLFDEDQLLKTTVVRSTENVHYVTTEGDDEYLFYHDDKSGEWRWFSRGYLPALNLVVEDDGIFDAAFVEMAALEGYGDSTSMFAGGIPDGSAKLFTFDEDRQIRSVTRGFFPQLNLATDERGFAHTIATHRIRDTAFFMGFIPDHSRIGDFSYDGTGKPDNIKIFTEETPGTFRFATHDEIRQLAQTDTELPAIRMEPADDISVSEYDWIDELKPPNGSGKIQLHVYKVEVKNRFLTRTIEVAIETKKTGDTSDRLAGIVEFLRKTPAPLLNGVRSLELFDHGPTAYGFHTVDMGGVNYDGKKIRLFGISKFDNSDLALFHHELWHSQHGAFGSKSWQRILLAIKAGGYDELDVIIHALKSVYCERSWSELAAEAGSLLFLPWGASIAIEIPTIRSALMAALHDSETHLEGIL